MNKYINKDRFINTFLDLVALDCESYNETKTADYLKEVLYEMNLPYMEDHASRELKKICMKTLGVESNPANNLYACLPGSLPDAEDNKKKAFLLSAHMDTVHPGIGKKAIVHEDGRITSDGTTVLGADDLAGMAEIIEFLRIIIENDIPHPDIEILFPAAEEPYCQGSRLVDYSKIHSKMCLVLDMSGEIGRAAYAAPSIYSVYIHVHGKASHAGFAPEEGIHALYIASQAIAKLPYGHVEDITTVNIGTIEGGMGKNVVPEEIYMTGEIRSMKRERALYWADEIRRVFEECAATYGGSVDIKIEKEFDAYCLDEKERVIQFFKKSVEDLGLPLKLVETYGGSDGNNFNDYGIKSMVVAHGMNEGHSVREWCSIDDMQKVCELLLQFNKNVVEGLETKEDQFFYVI